MLQPDPVGPAGAVPAGRLLPLPRQSRGIPLWIGSWGSPAGLRRVARLADGWVASACNTIPEGFAANVAVLDGELERHHKPPDNFPNALVTMWTWITGSRSEAERAPSEVVAPLVGRDLAELRVRICVGSAGECAELLSSYARAGCRRVCLGRWVMSRARSRRSRARSCRECPAESSRGPAWPR
jgi:alkanesulfonate monooxygenase SsuD/methylene tetrahydromethanopterin reductase-like flavin-dependent oxidoreductase (luciferase family)